MLATDRVRSLLTIQYALTEDEVAKGKSAAYRANLKAENSPLKYWAIMLGIIALLGWRFYNEIIQTGNLVWVGVFVLIYAGLYGWHRWSSNVRKTAALALVTLDIRDDGLAFITSRQRTEVRWAAFSRLAEMPEFFLLQHAQTRAWHVIPKRAFAGEVEANWFGELVRQQLAGTINGANAGRISDLQERENSPLRGSTRISYVQYYTFGECFDIILASWFARGILVLLLGVYVVTIHQIVVEEGTSRRQLPVLLLVSAVPLLIMTIVSLLIFVFQLRRATKRQEARVSLGDDGISCNGSGGNHDVAWDTYHSFKETGRHFIVWQNASRNYLAIPKRCISSTSELQWLRQLLASRLKRSSWFLIP